MQTPRISASSYSNTAPLVWSFLYGSNRGKYELIMDNAPARSAELLSQKRVDAALVPVIAYQLIDDLRLVPDVCVGAREQVKSVCLVTKDLDLWDVESVALDVSSKTSVVLTKIIFQEFYGFHPKYKEEKPNLEEMLSHSQAALLIGDPALMVDETKYRKFDLAEIWKEFTGFGFVFAMWMANAEKVEVAKTIDFAHARDEGLHHLDEIIANYESEISLSNEEFHTYLNQNISYSVDDSMQKGLERFFELAYKNKLIEVHKSPAFI